MNELNCVTHDISKLTEEIHRIRIAPESCELFDFQGGQYLYLLMPDGKRIPLSIASAAQEKSYLELHIRLIEGHQLAADMIELFQTAKRIHIEGPYGKCFLTEGERPVVIIAGGTGFSPMKSLLESQFAKNSKRSLALYLGVEKEQDLYQADIIANWPNSANFSFVPVVNKPGNDWQGETGFPHDVAIRKCQDTLSDTEFFVSGSEPMVMSVYQSLLDKGVPKIQIHSDILDIKREMGKDI
ncbi:MAG: FAD-binding oxidoreductase [Kangiellaceae bacterium]|nr:FAD-binding oxidoreductase [Kangiellaceae bacterium]